MATTNAGTATGPLAGTEDLLDAFELMLTIRLFEEEVQLQFTRATIHGTTHLCNGQEAVPAGVGAALRPDDYLAATYRGHGHTLARGIEAEALMAELMGRETGVNGGRAGSLNVIDRSKGLLGCYGIIGGTIAAATGAAIGARGQGRVALAAFGDGTTNHGYFAECLNFAKVNSLPVVYICENNGYGEYTPMERVTAGNDLVGRARVFDIPAERVDGNDVRAVAVAAAEAIEHARSGDGPAFLECVTYRHVGHSRSDPGRYRPEGELEQWLERDPLTLTRQVLIAEGIDEGELAAREQAVRDAIGAATQAALAAPWPEPPTTTEEYAHGRP